MANHGSTRAGGKRLYPISQKLTDALDVRCEPAAGFRFGRIGEVGLAPSTRDVASAFDDRSTLRLALDSVLVCRCGRTCRGLTRPFPRYAQQPM